jgi:hypothetical protein
MNAFRMPKGCFCDGRFFLDAHVVVFGKGDILWVPKSLYETGGMPFGRPRVFFATGWGVLWLPRSLCEAGGMGRFCDGILGYFCNVFSWAKLPA